MADTVELSKIPHDYTAFANRELLWLPMDTEERWNQHLADPAKKQLLINNGWWPPQHFTYRLNSHGFRSEEFDLDPVVLCLGCSLTMGLGLPVGQIWPVILQHSLGIKCFNLGLAGCSADTCYRVLKHYICELNVVGVACLLPNQDRVEIMIGGKYVNFVPQSRHLTQFYKTYVSEESNMIINRDKNLSAMRFLCVDRGVPFVWHCVGDSLGPGHHNSSMARDLAHPGHAWQIALANTMLDQFRSTAINI